MRETRKNSWYRAICKRK